MNKYSYMEYHFANQRYREQLWLAVDQTPVYSVYKKVSRLSLCKLILSQLTKS